MGNRQRVRCGNSPPPPKKNVLFKFSWMDLLAHQIVNAVEV